MGLRQEKWLLVSGSLSHPSYLAHAYPCYLHCSNLRSYVNEQLAIDSYTYLYKNIFIMAGCFTQSHSNNGISQ